MSKDESNKKYTETEILLAVKENRCIILPVALNTPVCVIHSNQHDGYWIDYEGFTFDMRHRWLDTVFPSYPEALARKNQLSIDSGFTV